MACSFSANQFDNEFRAPKLCNWEVPQYHLKRPETRKNATKIIANDRGHLLPGVFKPINSPWGEFKGTWQLPEKISRTFASQLNTSANSHSRWKKRTPAKRHPPVDDREEQHSQSDNHLENKHSEKQEADLEYTPGDLTSPKHQHPNRDLLVQQRSDRNNNKETQSKLNDLYIEKHECTDVVSLLNDEENKHREIIPHVLGDDVVDNFEEMKKIHYRNVTEKPHEGGTLSPIVPAYCNFQMARKMAQENLEHQPLPDAVADKAYRRLQAQGILNPGMALDVIPHVTGIGVKNYKAGPTQCTKLRVFRPKTCGVVPNPLDKSRLTNRPHTSIEKKSNMGAMDLAICWDYRPLNPKDEPKPPTHIDGSNGSAAPGIFTLVKSPRSHINNIDTGRSGGVFSNTIGEGTFFDKDVIRQHQYHRKKHPMERLCSCGNSVQSLNDQDNLNKDDVYPSRNEKQTCEARKHKRCKSSPNLTQSANNKKQDSKENGNISKSNNNDPIHLDTKSEQKHIHNHHHHRRRSSDRPKTSTQEIDLKPIKPLRLCEEPSNINTKEQKIPYKMAFKAGIPNSNSSGTCTSFDSGCSSMATQSSTCSIPKVMNVPKPRQPYSKKNYNINTLVPPFACWRGGAGQGGYPEHWRLASVYQHAFKPIDQRRRPLLATVYQ